MDFPKNCVTSLQVVVGSKIAVTYRDRVLIVLGWIRLHSLSSIFFRRGGILQQQYRKGIQDQRHGSFTPGTRRFGHL